MGWRKGASVKGSWAAWVWRVGGMVFVCFCVGGGLLCLLELFTCTAIVCEDVTIMLLTPVLQSWFLVTCNEVK